MFTGIIECLGEVKGVTAKSNNLIFKIASPISRELKIDQSVAHDGVCLTVIKQDDEHHWVEAVQETLNRSSLGSWEVNRRVNLERAVKVGTRLDGHLVQGHVDARGLCTEIEDQGGSWKISIQFPSTHANLVIDKGSIAIDGISLTVVEPTTDHLSVAIIPYTMEHTTLGQLKTGDQVNLEFDLIGKYVLRGQELRSSKK